MSETYFPGTRVLAFDNRLFKNDITTPLSMTMREATVVKWYGQLEEQYIDFTLGPYESLVDLIFDGETKICKSKFTDGLEVLRGAPNNNAQEKS